MISGADISAEKQGRLLVAYSDDSGATLGVEFSSTTQATATAIMGVCTSTIGDSTSRLVTSTTSGDTSSNSSGGGDNMERRLAVLEAEVSHIQSDVSELKSESKTLLTTTLETKGDVKVILQKLVDLDEKIAGKAGTSLVDAKVGEIKTWMLGIILLSVAMPVIMFLLNLAIKKS